MKLLDQASIRERIQAALQEDLHFRGDVTTKAIFPHDAQGRALVTAKAEGIICGGPVFCAVFEQLGGVTFRQLIPEGERVRPGDCVLELEGGMHPLLAGERTALNFLMRLSGIATATRRMVDAGGGAIQICDTRKTTPLWRDLEKYAVRTGGGVNHRMGLYDMVMIKDTHADGAGGLAEALRRAENLRNEFKVAAECRDMVDVRAALDAKADLIMLDNMDDEQLREAISLIGVKAETEVTGGVTLERLKELAALGVNRVSVGALTHSAPALDFSMTLAPLAREQRHTPEPFQI